MKWDGLKNAFKLIHIHGKKWALFSLFTRILMGILPFVSLKLLEKLVNEVTGYLSNDSQGLKVIFLLLFFQFLVTISRTIIQHVNEVMDMEMEYKLDFIIGRALSEKAVKVPYHNFENAEFYNTIERIGNNQGTRILSPLKHLLDICQAVISFGSYIVFLAMVHWSLVVISVIVAVPTLFVQARYGSEKFFLMKYTTKEAREANFISALFQNKEGNKEIRLFNLSNYLLSMWERLTLYTNNKAIQLMKREKRTLIILDSLTALMYVGASWIIINLLRSSKLGVGQFVSIGQAIQGAQGVINSAAVSLARIYEEQLYLNDYFSFMEHEDETFIKPASTWIDTNSAITISNVNFSYSDQGNNVLKNIDLTIKKGEKIAIVGENGSGKTTLVKCILGLYPITNGDIYVHQKNIQAMEPQEISDRFSAIFQDFITYPFSLRENVAFGDLKHLNNDELLLEMCKQSGLSKKIESFPDGLDTKLGKFLYEGSEELSGGQWQRLAIARAILKDSDILIMDEPTSALDPLTEMDIFAKLDSMAKNKTAIFVSHRMAAARFADRILVMKDGEIIESGTHEELISKPSEYSQLFNLQAKWYA
ncbi:ABC transporter ATP-binding protein [Fictibacillus aquaticus]|uniref:ABC transporter ATP-binding protein n=1 Tax=Fictibacillus aquaticus TaxID=2021314 RepID=A0A235F5U5_9BACL|nr:ABC transporter ATP-binding protein [Fictibacillus aquaticus]OYD56602.1 hypothetical protein CGZ90_16450 [Fictibacillus aquaticus]